MQITNENAVIQALANIRLEGLTVPPEIVALFNKAIKEGGIDTNDILDLIKTN